VAVKIRLKRMGKIRAPHYRIVVADSRKKRDGRVIEEIGKYHPKQEPSLIEVKSERAQYWLGVGAQPSEAVAAILKITGDWQKFKGEPGAEGTLRVAEPKRDKAELFNEALKESGSEPQGEAVTKTPTKKAAKKAPAKAPGGEAAPVADPAPAKAPVAEAAPVADPAPAKAPGDSAPAEAPADSAPATEASEAVLADNEAVESTESKEV
jgi:small subunit ribosomal protein S16